MPANFTVIMRSELIIIRFFSLRKSDISLMFSTESAVSWQVGIMCIVTMRFAICTF